MPEELESNPDEATELPTEQPPLEPISSYLE